jgi:hypothetical protein
MKCPGQDMQFWKPGDIFEVECPACKGTVEFFKDDTARRCGHCGHRFANPQMDFGCAAYCPYADQCLGDLPPEVAAQQEHLLKDKVAVAVKQYYGRDFKRIGHAGRVARYAEQLARAEGAALAPVLVAAYLLDVDQAAAGGNGGLQVQDPPSGGAPVARAILDRVHARADLADAVCVLLRSWRQANSDSPVEARVLYDADRLARLEVLRRDDDRDGMRRRAADPGCQTSAGRLQASALLGAD